MSKITGFYKDGVDKAWYDSSNVVYSECIDNENDFKTLFITFKGGKTYKYSKVDVNDYLLFREDSSQGKCFNRIIKKYECEQVEPKDEALLIEELETLLHPANEWQVQYTVYENSMTLTFVNNLDASKTFSFTELLEKDKKKNIVDAMEKLNFKKIEISHE